MACGGGGGGWRKERLVVVAVGGVGGGVVGVRLSRRAIRLLLVGGDRPVAHLRRRVQQRAQLRRTRPVERQLAALHARTYVQVVQYKRSVCCVTSEQSRGEAEAEAEAARRL